MRITFLLLICCLTFFLAGCGSSSQVSKVSVKGVAESCFQLQNADATFTGTLKISCSKENLQYDLTIKSLPKSLDNGKLDLGLSIGGDDCNPQKEVFFQDKHLLLKRFRCPRTFTEFSYSGSVLQFYSESDSSKEMYIQLDDGTLLSA